MSEKVSEKRVNRRNVVVALGCLCIILVVGVVGTMETMDFVNGKDKTIAELTNQNNQLRTWLDANQTSYDNYVTSHHNNDSDYDSLAAQNAYLQSQISFLYNVTGLKNDITLLNGTEHIESYSKQIWELAQAAYPGFNSGYMSYWIMTSTTNSTTLTITSTSPSGTTIFNQTLIIGTSGRVVYPVLRSNVTIITETSEPAVITEQQNLYY